MSRRILALLFLLLPLVAEAETLVGRVVGVTDGDTIKVLVENRTIKVRLAEIDTPERGQPWASRAKQALSDKVFGEEIEVRILSTDRYGRTVGHVWIGDRHINREMVREGHAWVYRRYLDDKTLLDDETHAQQNGIGLWGCPKRNVYRRGIGGVASAEVNGKPTNLSRRRLAVGRSGNAARWTRARKPGSISRSAASNGSIETRMGCRVRRCVSNAVSALPSQRAQYSSGERWRARGL